MDTAVLRRLESGAIGDSERLVAAVLAAAREQLDLELRYEIDPAQGGLARTVPIEAKDGRILGVLTADRPLSPADRRAVSVLARLVGNRLGDDNWTEHHLRGQSERVRRVLQDKAIDVALQPIFDLNS